MVKIIKNLTDLKNLIPSELLSIYEIETESIKADLQEKGMLSPIVLSKDGVPIDGYRRLFAAIESGLKEVPVIESDLEASKENRVTLNQQRDKTWMDQRSDLLISFETFGNKQGQKSPAAYNRYEEIGKRIRYKDPKSLRQVEDLLKKDVENHAFAYWLLERKSDLTSLQAVMEMMQKGENLEVISQVLEMKLEPKKALKNVKDNQKELYLRDRVFKMPQSNKESCIVTFRYKEEVLKELKKDNVMMFFYEPDICSTNFDKSYSSRTDHNFMVSLYATKVATDIKPFVDKRLHKEGSVFISVREFYSNGIARQLPAEVIRNIEKETNLIYKQTFVCTGVDSFTKVSRGNQLPDVVTYLLWFVKDPNTKMRGSTFEVFQNADPGEGAPTIYAQCANYLNRQTIPGLIQIFREKDAQLDPASLVPVFLSTQENDLVVDLSMKGDLVSAAALMNRRFIGLQSFGDELIRSEKQLNKALEMHDEKYANQLSQSLGLVRSEIEMEKSQFELV
jgi:hypothetical protein